MRVIAAVAAFAVTLILAGVAAAGTAPELAWMRAYVGRSTNAFVWDPHLAPALRSGLVPAALLPALADNLGGPPGPVRALGSGMGFSACLPHSCGDKGFLWVDTASGEALGAVAACELRMERLSQGSLDIDPATGLVRNQDPVVAVLALANPLNVRLWEPCVMTLGARRGGPQELSAAARQALMEWIAEENLGVATAEWVDAAGAHTRLDAAQFAPPARYVPPPGGPSFACDPGGAGPPNGPERPHPGSPEHLPGQSPAQWSAQWRAQWPELALCTRPELARLDLELATLYEVVRTGLDTLPAREELRSLQRRWLNGPRKACVAGDTDCLARAYRAQQLALVNFKPRARPPQPPRPRSSPASHPG
jgi:hypothetical protein